MLPMKPIFSLPPTEAELHKACDVLTKATGDKWRVQEGGLIGNFKVDAMTWEEAEANYANKLRRLGIAHFNVSGTLRGMPEGKATVTCSINHSKEIRTIAMKAHAAASAALGALAQGGISRQALEKASFVLGEKTGFPNWRIEGEHLVCNGAIEAPTWQEATEKVSRELQSYIGENTFEVTCTKRGMEEGMVSFHITCKDPLEIERLAELRNPQVVLSDQYGNPRSLATAAATLCVVLDVYSKEKLSIENPDYTLPFPLLQWSKQGLDIKLPTELTTDVNMEMALEKFTKQKAKKISEKHFNKKYVAKVTIPWQEVRSLIKEGLGLERVTVGSKTFDTIEDMIVVKQGSGSPFTPEQVKLLRGQ